MRIITINVPEIYLEMIEKLTLEDDKLYPSRSEVCRQAIGDFLERKLKLRRELREEIVLMNHRVIGEA